MTPSLYGYIQNNPINLVDPLGLWSSCGSGYGGDLSSGADVEGPGSYNDSTPENTDDGGYGWGPDGSWGFNSGNGWTGQVKININHPRYPDLTEEQCYQQCYAASAISCGLMGWGASIITGGFGGFVVGAACSDFMSNACDAECDPNYDGCLTGKCDG